MTRDASGSISRRTRWGLIALPVLLALAGWLLLQSFTGGAATECYALYRAAVTADDSARVDNTVPKATGISSTDRHTCGFMRSSARWQ